MWAVVFALALMTVLTGCSDPIQSGTVVKKVYDDPDDWTYWSPTYCPSISSINGMIYTFYYACGGSWEEGHDGPHWEFRLQDDKDPKHHGWVEVSEKAYGMYEVGSHWPDPR